MKMDAKEVGNKIIYTTQNGDEIQIDTDLVVVKEGTSERLHKFTGCVVEKVNEQGIYTLEEWNAIPIQDGGIMLTLSPLPVFAPSKSGLDLIDYALAAAADVGDK